MCVGVIWWKIQLIYFWSSAMKIKNNTNNSNENLVDQKMCKDDEKEKFSVLWKAITNQNHGLK